MPRKGSVPVAALACPHCGGSDSGVIDARGNCTSEFIRRRRRCACGHRFTTYETTRNVPALITIDGIFADMKRLIDKYVQAKHNEVEDRQ